MTHLSRTALIAATGIVLTGCALLPGGDSGPSVCDEDERTELFAVDLGDSDSPAFEVTDDIRVFVAVISDPRYDPKAFDRGSPACTGAPPTPSERRTRAAPATFTPRTRS